MHLTRRAIDDPAEWNSTLMALPGAHILHSWEWGELKADYGWRPLRVAWFGEGGGCLAAALVLRREFRFAHAPIAAVFYCPRGPALDWSDPPLRAAILSDLEDTARSSKAVFLKIDPEVEQPAEDDGRTTISPQPSEHSLTADLQARGWRFSAEQIQFRNTLVIDLRTSEQELLAQMKQKTRYNVRLAQKQGVRVRAGGLQDLDLLYRLYAQTSVRDGFVIRSPDYYQRAWGSFIASGLAVPLLAEVEGEVVAAVIPFRFGPRAWYLYGMSSERHREKMPNYLLQWEAMRWAKSNGCTTYDLWGAPDILDPSDPMWGVYRFKLGLGGRFVGTLGAWDYTTRPVPYRLYHSALPRLLSLMRGRGMARTRRSLE